jgi:hypothetical protein
MGKSDGAQQVRVGQIATPVHDDEQSSDQIERRPSNFAERTSRSPAGPDRTTGAVSGAGPPEDPSSGVDPPGEVPPGEVSPGAVPPGVDPSGVVVPGELPVPSSPGSVPTAAAYVRALLSTVYRPSRAKTDTS